MKRTTSTTSVWQPAAFGTARAALFVLAATLGLRAFGAQGRGDDHVSRQLASWSTSGWELAVGFPGIPPAIQPETIQKFLLLFASFQALEADTPISFAQWIIANGVTDPREQVCLLWLYWHYINRVAVD